MDTEQRKRLADKSGANNNARPPKYVVPLIRFDGNRGEYRIIRKDKEGQNIEEDLKTPFEFVILKKRRLLSAYAPTQSLFTNEHNSTNDRLMLFKVISHAGKSNVSLETTGYTADLREKYQTLKTHEVVYVLFNGEVCKMEIKGGSLGGYYDYQKALQSEEKHSFEVTTLLKSEKVKNEQGFTFYKMTFDFRPEVSVEFDVLEEKIDEVAKACEEADAYTRSKINEKVRPSVGGNTLIGEEAIKIKAMKEAAQKDFDNFGKEDIDVDAIPF